MKMRHCRYQGCRHLVAFSESYCHDHELVVASQNKDKELEEQRLREMSQGYQQAERHTRYANSNRAEELGHAFYQTVQWRKLSARIKVRDLYIDAVDNRVYGNNELIVDHIVPRRTAPELSMSEDNLWLLSREHHNSKSSQERLMTDDELRHMTKEDWIKRLSD
nr:MAG TPA: NinG protein [Caudoviricetes sp.]